MFILNVIQYILKNIPTISLAILINVSLFFTFPFLYTFLNSSTPPKDPPKSREITLYHHIKTPVIPPKRMAKIFDSKNNLQTSPISAIPRPFKLNLEVSQNSQGIATKLGHGSNIATYEMGQTDTDPQIIGNPSPPKTPARAKREHVSGKVVVQWIVNEFGRSVEIEIIQENPTGYNFGKQVIHYIKKIKFKPATVQKTAVRSIVKQNFNFRVK